MVHRSYARTVTAVLASGALAASAILAAPAAVATGSKPQQPKPVAAFDGPRGVDVDESGRIVVGAADGTISLVTDQRRHPKVREIGSVPAGFIAPAVAAGRHGTVYALTPQGDPAAGANTLYLLRKGKPAKPIANIAAYQQKDPDPFDLEGNPTESNPFGVAALKDGSVLVADAAGNDLLRVFPNGRIVTVARLKPRTVAVPAGLPDAPPAGTMVPSEAVATSVTVGSDGYWYVGELRGFPATPDTSQIWRIKPGTKNAVCDPAKPRRGDCRRFADGLTSIVDLAPGSRGSIYAVELARNSWLRFELDETDNVGALIKVRPGGSRTELVPGKLILPGGADPNRHGKIYVTGPVFGPGSLWRIG